LSLVTLIIVEFCGRAPTPALPRKRERERATTSLPRGHPKT
jgi:hypothetical protein